MKPESFGQLPDTIESLPPLEAGSIRLDHITHKSHVADILTHGLDYDAQGMISSVTRGWDRSQDIVWKINDRRFSGDDVVHIVIDMPFDMHKLHNNITKAPGRVPPEYIVGAIPEYNLP